MDEDLFGPHKRPEGAYVGKETALSQLIQRRLRALGAVSLKILGGPRQPKTVDIVACLPGGHFLAIESKIWPRKPTSTQTDYLRAVRAAGGTAVLAYSLEDVLQELNHELQDH